MCAHNTRPGGPHLHLLICTGGRTPQGVSFLYNVKAPTNVFARGALFAVLCDTSTRAVDSATRQMASCRTGSQLLLTPRTIATRQWTTCVATSTGPQRRCVCADKRRWGHSHMAAPPKSVATTEATRSELCLHVYLTTRQRRTPRPRRDRTSACSVPKTTCAVLTQNAASTTPPHTHTRHLLLCLQWNLAKHVIHQASRPVPGCETPDHVSPAHATGFRSAAAVEPPSRDTQNPDAN